MIPVISLKNLTKSYGTARGVSDITLDVPEGSIFGFLGPNGAGKSTTINMLINLSRPTSGSIHVFGKDASVHGLDIRRDIGFLSSDMAMDGHLTGREQLEYFGWLRGGYDRKYVAQLADRLGCELGRRQRNLSRGNRQKISLVSALMHRPKLLILDEPTSGLDPLIQAEFNKILLEHKAAGHTTFISSHVLSEIQELCDHVAFIREGRVVANTTIDEMARSAPKHVRITGGDAKLSAAIKKLKGASDITSHRYGLRFAYTGEPGPLLALLSKHKFTDVNIENTDLESTFMTYYEESHA